MSVELARRLLAWGASPAEVEAALLEVVTRGVSLVKAVAEVSPGLLEQMEREVGRLDLPAIEMVRASPDIAAELPPGLCERLVAVPVHRDPRSGRVDVAAADAFDTHVEAEFSFHLSAPVRVLRARFTAVSQALSALRGARSVAPVRPERGSGPRSSVRVPPSDPPPLNTPEKIQEKSRQTDPMVGLSAPRYEELTPEDAGEPVLSLTRPKGPTAGSPPSASKAPEPDAPDEAEEAARVLAALERAVAPEEVLELCCSGLEPFLVVALAARGSFFEARSGSAELRDPPERLKQLRVPVAPDGVLARAAEHGFYLGALADEQLSGLRELLKLNPREEVYIAPIVVLGRASVMLVVSRLGATTTASRRVDEMVKVASQALERIVRNRKRGTN